MTESDFYRELFYLARRNIAIAFKMLENLSDTYFDFNLIEKYLSSRDRNELMLVREIVPRIDPKTTSKAYLIKKSADHKKPARAQSFYASITVELFLKNLSLEEAFRILPRISGKYYFEKIKEELLSREKDESSFENLIYYQQGGDKTLKEMSRILILSIPKNFLNKDLLLSIKKLFSYSDEISLELLLIHFEDELSNDFIMNSMKHSSEELTIKAENILEKRFSENKIDKNFIEKYLNSKSYYQFELAVKFSQMRKLDENESVELSTFCSEYLF